MFLSFLLAAIIGAALFGGGFYFGLRVGQQKAVPGAVAIRPRRPQCYTLDPKDFDEEDRAE